MGILFIYLVLLYGNAVDIGSTKSWWDRLWIPWQCDGATLHTSNKCFCRRFWWQRTENLSMVWSYTGFPYIFYTVEPSPDCVSGHFRIQPYDFQMITKQHSDWLKIKSDHSSWLRYSRSNMLSYYSQAWDAKSLSILTLILTPKCLLAKYVCSNSQGRIWISNRVLSLVSNHLWTENNRKSGRIHKLILYCFRYYFSSFLIFFIFLNIFLIIKPGNTKRNIFLKTFSSTFCHKELVASFGACNPWD